MRNGLIGPDESLTHFLPFGFLNCPVERRMSSTSIGWYLMQFYLTAQLAVVVLLQKVLC